MIKTANLALRFLLELSLLAAFGYWGFRTGPSPVMKVVLGIGLPILVAVIWGVFLAPASARRLADPARLIVELVIFGAAVAALYSAGQPYMALALGLVYVVNRVLLSIWKQ